MTNKLYAQELLKKIVNESELEILESIWDDNTSPEEKIDYLLKRDGKQCSSSR